LIPTPATTVQFSNGFEGNPFNDWQKFAGGDGTAGFNTGTGFAFDGANNGWLFAGNGWAAERILVPISSWGNRSNCTARIWAQPVGFATQVGLQVWDANGTSLLTGTTGFVTTGFYQQITTAPVNLNGSGSVYVQAIYGNNNSNSTQFIRLDDVSLTCVS
jgi:hypothetical protein